MFKTDWMHQALDAFVDDDAPLSYTVPGDTPGHSAALDIPHEVFHEQTKYHRATSAGIFQNIAAHLKHPELIKRSAAGRHPQAPNAIALPIPGRGEVSLVEALAQRKSHRREEVTTPLSAQTLSTLLHYAVSTNRSEEIAQVPGLAQHFSPYPSAGALYPCEVYVALAAVEGVLPGVYRYHAVNHTLSPCRSGDNGGSDFISAETSYGQDAAPPACAFIITSVFQRSVRKYGPRGYRLAIIEAGHILQNLSLLATALDLASLVSASIYESEVEALIDVDGVSEAVLACFLCGSKNEE